jgi:hypothetical protein
MKTRIIFIFAITAFTALSSFSQSKKDIKVNKIATETSYITVTENGKDVTYKDSYTVYDKEGRVTEQTDFYKDGTVKHKEVNKYDSQKNKIEESVYDAKTDAKGPTFKKNSYVFNTNNDKVGETEYDANGKILKQSVITYDNRGLKTDRKTYSADKKLISTKKYVYTYR